MALSKTVGTLATLTLAATAAATRMVKATQTVFHDGARPSALVLPIVPR
jgi:hypothetical protein